MAREIGDVELLAEANRLLNRMPPKETFRHDTPANQKWLGQVANLITLWDSDFEDDLNDAIDRIHNIDAHVGTKGRRDLCVLLERVKRSLELRAGLTSPDDYVEVPETVLNEIRSGLSTLREFAQGSNAVDEDTREMVLAEIASFEASICQPRVSSDLIYRFNTTVLKSAAMQLIGASAQEIASRLVTLLLSLLVASAA